MDDADKSPDPRDARIAELEIRVKQSEAVIDQLAAGASVRPLWIILPIFALLGWRGFREDKVLVLWLALLAQFCIYVFAYTISRADLNWLLQTSLDRLLIHLSPIAILLIGFHWSSIVGGGAQGAGSLSSGK